MSDITFQRSGVSPIFVGGAGRSGTTLMRVILNAHPNLSSGAEFKLLPDIMALYNKMKLFEPILESYSISETALNGIFSQFIMSLFSNFLARSSGQRLVEKTPHNVLIMKELIKVFPMSKFIHMVRDGRDTVSSLVSMNWVDVNGQPLWYTKDVQNATQYWSSVVRQGLNDASVPELIGRVKLVRYEDLVRDTKATIAEVLQFMGEEWADSVMDYHLLGRQTEPEESSTKQVSSPVYQRSVHRWKTEFSEGDKNTFKTLAGDLLVQLGYESSLTW